MTSSRASLTFFIIDANDHGEGCAQGDDAIDRTGPGALALLDLHPAVDVVAWKDDSLGYEPLCCSVFNP